MKVKGKILEESIDKILIDRGKQAMNKIQKMRKLLAMYIELFGPSHELTVEFSDKLDNEIAKSVRFKIEDSKGEMI